MPKWGLLGCVALVCATPLAACSLAGEEDRNVDVGVWEYFIRDADPATADQKMAELTVAGFRAAITNSFWEPGRREPIPQELAELTGTTLFTVSRILTEWETAGLVRSTRAHVEVVDAERLRDAAESVD